MKETVRKEQQSNREEDAAFNSNNDDSSTTENASPGKRRAIISSTNLKLEELKSKSGAIRGILRQKPAGANMLAAEETSGVSQCCESLYSVSQNDIVQIQAHEYNPQ